MILGFIAQVWNQALAADSGNQVFPVILVNTLCPLYLSWGLVSDGDMHVLRSFSIPKNLKLDPMSETPSLFLHGIFKLKETVALF